jgi:hypothetical protein
MADQPVRFTPLGNLDKDSEYKLVGKGNYTDALDIIKQDDSSQVSGTIQPTKRNKHAFSLGSVQAQNKKYRVTVDGDSTKKHRLKFLSTKRDVSITQASQSDGSIWFEGTVGSLLYFFNQSSLPGAFQVTVSGNTVEFELVAYDYYQWYLESVGDDDVEVVCIQEAIPTDLAGPLKDIGSYDLLGDLFVFSTTQDNESTELDVQIAGVGPVSPNPLSPPPNVFSGPLTQLFFNGPHGLQEGQWIVIIDSSADWLNGTFVVNNIISPTDVNIVTDTAWGATHPVSSVGPAKVFIHTSGIGEIGVAQKNNSTESWTYTRLLRSVELNLLTTHRVDLDCEKNVERVGIYFDDDYNTYRKFYYYGEYQEDGALNYVNSLNEYSYGSLTSQLYGFQSTPVLSLSFEDQLPNGGVLESGSYRYFVVLKDYFGNESEPTDLSNQVIVYSDSQDASAVGDDTGVITDKVNRIRIDNIFNVVYEEYAIGYLTVINGVFSSYLLPFENIPNNVSTVIYPHTGLEEVISYDVGTFATKSFSNYDFAKNINIVDQRIVRSNLRKNKSADLESFFESFKHAVCADKSIDNNFLPNQNNPAGEFKDPSNVFYKTGYMFNETYRFAGRVIYNNGNASDWYWVDDIKIDPFITNEANPNDNRRSQSSAPNAATSFDLVEDIPNIPSTYSDTTGYIRPSGSYYDNTGQYVDLLANPTGDFYSNNLLYNHKKVIVPYVEFFDIDLSKSVNGLPLSDLISHIEIGRSPCIKEVIASGVGVSSVKIITTDELNREITTVGDVYRGLPLAGEILVGDVRPRVSLGIGVRTDDLDGVNETYHEYPFVYSSAPFSAHRQDTATIISGNIFQDTLDYYSNTFVQSSTQPEGSFINVFMGVNFNYSAVPYTNLVLFPTLNEQDFYRSDICETSTLQNLSVEPSVIPTFTNTLKSERRILSIYSPDFIFGGFDALDDDYSQVIDFGEMFLDKTTTSLDYYWRGGVNNLNDTHVASCAAKYYPENLSDTYNKYSIDNHQFINSGDRENLFGGFNGFRKAHDGYIFSDRELHGGNGNFWDGWKGLWKMQSGPVIHVENNGDGITNQGKNDDHGIRYIQLFKQKGLGTPQQSKYGPIDDSEYYTTGPKYPTSGLQSNIIGPGVIKVFGGDTYTQQSFLKTKIADPSVAPGGGEQISWDEGRTTFPPDKGPGFSGGLFVYTQNRINSQMRYDTDDQFIMLRETVSTGKWAWDFSQPDRHTYSGIYDSLDGTSLSQANGNIGDDPSKFDFPTRITWSLKKIYSEIQDSYTQFRGLNIKDLSLSFGEIHHHEDINGELFTLQPRKYQLQYFNTRGTLQGSNEGVEVLIGDGSVLSRDGQTLSSYGTQHKWSVVKGASQGGKDVIYWFNQENGLFMRFGADGTVVLSERSGIRSFSANNTRWTENQYSPALNYGIRSVWDDRFKEAIWTFIGIRENRGDWGVGNKYGEGDIVIGGTFDNYSFDGIPDVYVSISPTHTSSLQTEPGVGGVWEAYWKKADKDDPEYYSVFTLAFNELSNGFSTFYSHIPKTYLKWKNKFLSSHPTERSEIYEHRYGYDKWYEYEGVWKESDPYLEGVVNPFPDQSKKFVAIQALTDNVPDRIELKTKDHESFLVATDFDAEDDAWRTPIKNDILTSQTGDPNDDTVSLIGSYMRVKFKFFNGAYNKMNNLVVKVRQRLRRTQS